MTLTKTLKFEEETLQTLRRVQWAENGLSAVILDELDRPQYEKVNKALVAMGGKWNRSAKAHLFKTDPRQQVDGLLENGSVTVERDGFFETPRAVVERMLEIVPMEYSELFVLEPSAGMGAIARVLCENDPTATAYYTLIEKNNARAEFLRTEFVNQVSAVVHVIECGFLEYFPDGSFDRIYMNPPFEEGQDIDHVRHAYELLEEEGGKMIAVMSEGVFFRSDRKAVEFRNWLESVSAENEKLPERTFKESGTGVNTRLVWFKK